MSRPPREDEAGMVLVNVLLLVGLAAAVLAIMVAGDDAALQRATRMAGAAQAAAIARAGEQSAITALRRDMTTGPDSDDASEAWARIAERGAPIEGGRFALAIADATGKIDLNALVQEDPVTLGRLRAIAAALRLPPGSVEKIAAVLANGGAIVDIAELSTAGLTPDELQRLAGFATVLPLRAAINLNAAPEPVLALLLDDPGAAHALVAVRRRNGRLTRQDFSNAQAAIPPGAGFVSSFFWSVARGTSGDTSQQVTSLIERRRVTSGPEAIVVARWRGTPPLQAPLLSDDPAAN